MQTTSEGIPYPEASDPFPITPLFKKMADGMNTAVGKANTNASNALTAANTATSDAAAAKTAATSAQTSATNAANSASAAQTAAGSLTAGTVTTVATGQPATAAVRVVGSTRYIDLGLPQGATGATGQTGPAGVTSAVANNLASGAAATASVANGVLTLGIPAGQAGPAGSAGPTGPAGSPELVRNGNGGLLDNTNFTQFTFHPEDGPVGTLGSFVTSTGASLTTFTNDLIPVDPARQYLFRFSLRQVVPGAKGNFYGFIVPLDRSGNNIQPQHYMYISGTMTTLAADLKPGDTTLYLTSAANWYGSAAKPAGTTTYLRTFNIWNWKDSGGKTWAPGSYTRTTSSFNYWADGAVNTTTNTITLNSGWTGATIPAGTAISNTTSGGSYIYAPSSTNVTAQESWTAYQDIWPGGTMDPAAQAVTGAGGTTWTKGLPPGTTNIRLGWLLNYPTLSGGSQMAVAGVSWSEASAAVALATDAKGQAQAAWDGLASKADKYHSHTSTDINDLTTVLNTRALVDHTHTIAQVTGLQDALDGKAATTHTHAYTDVGSAADEYVVSTFPANWTNYDTTTFEGWELARVSRSRVASAGMIKTTTALSGGSTITAAGVVPTGLRPVKAQVEHLTGSQGGRILVYIQPDGAIKILAFGTVASGEYFTANFTYKA